MKIIVKLLRPYSNAVGKSELVWDLKGSTLEDLIIELVEKYPKLRDEVYEGKEFTEYLAIFINDAPSHTLQNMKTVLKEDDEILFFMPLSVFVP